MKHDEMLQWAKTIATQTGFVIEEKIYEATYYQKDRLRNMIFSGMYEDKPSILKVYSDPRPSLEPESLAAFHKDNTSTLLTAPQLYAWETKDQHTGWFIMEHLPEGSFFTPPLEKNDRKTFMKIFREYRTTFPTTPFRPLFETEELSAVEWTKARFSKWYKLYSEQEKRRKEPLYKKEVFHSLYNQAVEFIGNELENDILRWSHGHIKPQEIFCPKTSSVYYLTDFAHSQMLPKSYELAFIIWADWMMTDHGSIDYTSWKQGIVDWIDEMEEERKQESISKELLIAAILERTIGTLLADIGASDKSLNLLQPKADLHLQLAHDILEGTF